MTNRASNTLTWINGTRRLNFPRQWAACGPTIYISARPDALPEISVAASADRVARRASESAPDWVAFATTRNLRYSFAELVFRRGPTSVLKHSG